MSEQKQTRVTVTLKKPHTHAGVRYDEAAVKKGVEINVTERQAKAYTVELDVVYS